MSDAKSPSSSGGIGFCGALALLFIALKLLGYIDWSWWWVLSPLWIPVVLVGIGIGIALRIELARERRINKKLARKREEP